MGMGRTAPAAAGLHDRSRLLIHLQTRSGCGPDRRKLFRCLAQSAGSYPGLWLPRHRSMGENRRWLILPERSRRQVTATNSLVSLRRVAVQILPAPAGAVDESIGRVCSDRQRRGCWLTVAENV